MDVSYMPLIMYLSGIYDASQTRVLFRGPSDRIGAG